MIFCMLSVNVSYLNWCYVSSMLNVWFSHQEMFQWNGITSKKKGQQWGKENRSFTPRNDYKHQKKEYSEILGRGQQWEKENHSFTPRSDNKLPNKDYSEILSNDEEKQPDEGFDFETLPPLPSIPKVVSDFPFCSHEQI